jgi:hypothetical protein
MKETILKDDVEPNIQEAPPFTPKYLDSEKEETDSEILTLRFGKKHRQMLDVLKWLLCESKDATAIKYAIEWAKNDIQGKLSEDSWRKICAETRRKPIQKRPDDLLKL